MVFVEAERQACEIRPRAERKAGALLKDMDKQQGAPGTGSNQHQKTEADCREGSPPPQKSLADPGGHFPARKAPSKRRGEPVELRVGRCEDMKTAA